MSNSEFTFPTGDGLQLYGQFWQPEGSVRGVVCLVHGLGEHSGRYQHVGAFFNQAGYALVAMDLRGHGKSPGARGFTPSFAALLDDIHALLREGEARFPGLPLFLYGHSMGGCLVLNYLLQRQPDLAGAIASAPQLRTAFDPPAWKLTLGNLLYNLLPGFTMANGLELAALSRDTQIVQAYVQDPLDHDKISARLGIDILRQGEWALAHAGELALPLLLAHGDADRLTSAQASRQFAQKAGAQCTLRIWQGYYHEMHNDPGKEAVLGDYVQWLDQFTLKD